MERFGKTLKFILFPHMAIVALLIPLSTVLLVYCFVSLDSSSAVSLVSYVLSFYTLTVCCVRIPNLITFWKNFKRENRYFLLWTGDVRLRVRVSLYGAFIWNSAYAVFQLCLGLYHSSVWYFSLSAYYICLALMRFFLSRHTTKHMPREKMLRELREYRTCGIVFLGVNIALSAMVFLMIYQNKSTVHHEITTIALAAYTFTALTAAIINTVKYRKYESPVYSASKAISLASASVSMITLTSTMLASFGGGAGESVFRTYMLAGLGAAVAIFITTMAIYMIMQSTKKINVLKEKEKYE